MKKIALVLLALAIAFPLVAGDVDGASVSISGDATTTFGIDLDTSATGFTNTLNAKLRLDFGLEAASIGSGMEDGGIYGEVSIDEINIRTIENNNADIADGLLEMDIDLEYAKIMGPTWWVSVKGADAGIDYENATENGTFENAAATWDNVSNTIASSGGFEAGLDLGVASIELSVFSMTDWTDTTDDDNAYGVKAEVILSAVEDLTVKAAVNTGFGADAATTLNDDLGIGALLSYAIGVNDDVTITPEVGLDIQMLDDDTMDMAIGNGLKVSLAGDEITAAEDSVVDSAGTNFAWDDGVNSGLTVGWTYFMPGDTTVDASLALAAHVGLSMIENLQLAVGFEASDLMDSTNGNMSLALYADYDAGIVKPYAGMYMLVDGEMILDAGLELNDILPHVNVAVRYNSGDLAATTPVKGIAKIECKVKY